jgi:hypothetical protein
MLQKQFGSASVGDDKKAGLDGKPLAGIGCEYLAQKHVSHVAARDASPN